MLTLLTVSALLSLPVSMGTADDTPALAEACKKLASAENYTFTFESENTGGQARRGRGGEEPPAANTPTEGMYQKGSPVYLKRGDTVVYRSDEQMVYKNADGKWEVFDPQSMRGGFGRRGGQGGGDDTADHSGGGNPDRPRRGGPGGHDRRQGGQDRGQARGARGAMMGVFAMRTVQLPSELVEKIDTKVTDVTKEEKDGKTIYSGKLTEDAARALGSMGGGRFGGGRRGGGGGDAPQFDTKGTIQVTVANGQVEAIQLDTTVSGSFGDRNFERTSKSTIHVSKIGETKYEVPKEVQVLFTF